MVLPGGIWLGIFFLIPLVYMASASLMTGNPTDGYKLTWHFANYTDVFSLYKTQFLHSIVYAGAATIITLVVGFPVAYWIAFYGGRRKNFFLLLLLVPFFVSFVIRTLAWQFILSDEGVVLGTLKNWHLLPENFRVLATSWAVIFGIAYNFLPFMTLPLYVALEKIPVSVLEAAEDLYAARYQRLRRVTLPMALPGIVAGSLLTFIPAVGDYINAELLGNPQSQMIGNVIESRFLRVNDYPTGSALSFILMAAILIAVFIYARFVGTEQLTGGG